jgi:hypothetical protein
MSACVGHHTETAVEATAGHVCSGCRDKLSNAFALMPSVAVWIGVNLERGPAIGERISGGGDEAPVPIRLDVLDLVGPASDDTVHDEYHDQTGAPNLLAVMVTWAQLVAEEREMAPPKDDLASICGWMHSQVDWITKQPWVDDLLWDCHRLLTACRRVAPWEPELLRDHQEACEACGVKALVQHVAAGKVRCEARFGGCGKERKVTEYEWNTRHLRNQKPRKEAS